MRNLKRALSLGLTATMISGLMVMGSSAASYADVTSKQNEEAIEVLKTVGIMTGDENGKFNPEAKVTRNEMAVVMCNLLDYTVASYKGTSPFTDVPEWAEPYVAACYTNGITSGYDAKTYGGSDTVTTGQAALMLLKALGYFQYSADFGSDWLVETTKNGSTAGLFDGVATGAKEALTRNDVAQMVLNALEADLVKAEKNGSDVHVGDIVISGGKATYDARTGTDSKYAKIDNTKVDGKYTIQLGEDLYNGDLVKADGADDDFGRPSVKWTYENKEIGTYADDADAVYTATVEKQDLYDLVGSDVYNDLKNGDADFTVVVDGVAQKDVKLSDYIVKNNDDDAGTKDANGNLDIKKGATTEVFIDDDSNDVVITVINSYVAQVDGDYDKNDEELELDILDEAFVDVKDTTLSSDDFDYLDSYSDEDYVLITVANKEIKTIDLAETVEGKVTAYTEKKNVTVDGTKYEYSKNYTDAVKDDSKLSYDLNDAYTLVLDANGYVIYTDGTAGHNDYVYVAEIAPTGGAKADLEADAYFIDGTNKVVVVDNDDKIKDNTDFENKWYSYNEKSNGKYELEAITDEKNETYTVSADNQKIVENGKSSIYTDKVGGAKANNDTIFVVNDDDDVTAYTGIKNVPDITSKTADVTVAVVNDGAYADVVYIYSADMSISGDSGDRVYLLESKPNASVDKDDNKYYEYDAIVNGKITTVKATDNDLKIGLYQNVSYDENGYMDDQDLVKDASDDDFKVYKDIKAISYKAGVLSLGEGKDDVVLADKYTIFVNDDGDGKTTTPSSLAKNFGVDGTYSETVFVFEDDNDEAVEVYVYKMKDADKNDADKVDAKIDHVQMWADGGFRIVMNQKAEQDTNFTVELQQRVDGKYVSAGTKKVTLKKDATTVSDDGDKFLLDNGSVYKVVVNGVESNEVKGK